MNFGTFLAAYAYTAVNASAYNWLGVAIFLAAYTAVNSSVR